MMDADLLGKLEQVVKNAIRERGTYKKRSKEEKRAFGGVNVVMCADFWQLHPVSGTFLASNLEEVNFGLARNALTLFWGGRQRQRA